MNKIFIFDTTLRDGEQSIISSFKVAILKAHKERSSLRCLVYPSSYSAQLG